jgi:hypothetical protein
MMGWHVCLGPHRFSEIQLTGFFAEFYISMYFEPH